MEKGIIVKNISRRAGLFVAIVATASLMPMAAYATPTGTSELDEDSQVISELVEVMPAEETRSGDNEASSTKEGSSQAAICVAENRVDYPHWSTSTPIKYTRIQAHGNWDRGNCNATYADVTTQIDRKNPIGLFQAVGVQGKARLKYNTKGLTSGGAGRVTAGYPCNGTNAAPFRAWTSIDMVGLADTQTRLYTPATSPFACG